METYKKQKMFCKGWFLLSNPFESCENLPLFWRFQGLLKKNIEPRSLEDLAKKPGSKTDILVNIIY